MNLEHQIFNLLKNKQNVFLIGQSNAGKTWFVKNQLKPFLVSKKMNVKIFNEIDSIEHPDSDYDVFIIDEDETLQDQEYLEKKYPEDSPYYSQEYLAKVKNWFKILSQISQPCLYIVTRNDQADVDYLLNKVKYTDWDGRPVACLELKKIL